MTDLRKAAEMALEALDCLPWQASAIAVEATKALRQALAQSEQKPLGEEWVPCVKLPIVVHVRNQRDGETHISTREGITPVLPEDLIMRGVAGEEYPIGRELFERTYTFDVDAVNTSQERVDETAKRGQEPVAWYGVDDYDKKYLGWDKHDLLDEGFAWITPLYTAPQKREWKGLTDEETLDVLIRSRAAISAIRTDAGHPIKGSILMADTNEYLIDVLDKTIEKALKKS